MRYLIALVSIITFGILSAAADVNVTIDGSVEHKTIEGLGGFMESHNEDINNSHYWDLLFNDVGVSAVTWFAPGPNHPWASEEVETTLPMLRIAKSYGVNLFVCGIVDYDMTNNLEQNYDAYSDYMLWYIDHIKAETGVDITYISPDGEPDVTRVLETDYRDFLKFFGPILRNANSNIKILAPWGSTVSASISYSNTILSDQTARNYVDILGSSLYGWLSGESNPQDLNTLANIAQAYNKPTFYTECYHHTSGGMPPPHPAGIHTAKWVHHALVEGNGTGFLWFNMFDKGQYSPVGRGFVYSKDWPPGEFSSDGITKPGYAFKQFAHWVRPGAARISAISGDSHVLVSAFKHSTDNTVTIVAINDNPSSVDVNFNISGLASLSSLNVYRTSASEDSENKGSINLSTNSFTTTLPAESITTFTGTIGAVGDLTPPQAPQGLGVTMQGSSIALSWSPNPESDISHYTVYRSTTGDFNPSPADSIVGVTGTTYVDANVTSGTTYYYRLAAVDTVGNRSTFSYEISETVPLAGTTTVTLTPSADSWIQDEGGSGRDDNLDSVSLLSVGGRWQTTYFRSLIEFDLSSILSNATIIDAELRLYHSENRVEGSNKNDVSVYRVLKDWKESEVTCNSCMTGSLWTMPGADSVGDDRDSVPLATRSFTSSTPTNQYHDFTVTSAIQNFVDGTWPNHGFILIGKESPSTDSYFSIFHSKESQDNRPILTVTYTLADTQPPGAPQSLSASVTDSSAALNWAPNSESDLAYYIVYRSTTSGFTPSSSDSIAGIADTTYVDMNVASETTYYYRLAAVDNAGNKSSFSSEIDGTILSASTPPDPRIVSISIYPSKQINLGDKFRIKVEVKNFGGEGSGGVINIAFPDLRDPDDHIIVEYYRTGAAPGESGLNYSELPSGSTIYDKDGNSINAQYLSIEASVEKWKSGATKFLELRAAPEETGPFRVQYRSVIDCSDGKHYVTPATDQGYGIDQQGWYVYQEEILVKQIPTTDVEAEDDLIVPEDYVLLQNYPNPFNPETAMKYGLPKESHVVLTVYNVLGQEISRLIDKFQPAGWYCVKFNGKGLPSGVYIYGLEADRGRFVEKRKMVLVR